MLLSRNSGAKVQKKTICRSLKLLLFQIYDLFCFVRGAYEYFLGYLSRMARMAKMPMQNV